MQLWRNAPISDSFSTINSKYTQILNNDNLSTGQTPGQKNNLKTGQLSILSEEINLYRMSKKSWHIYIVSLL